MKFLLVLAQQNTDFRVQELTSIADMLHIKVSFENYSDDSPFLEIELNSEEDARRLVSRSILSKAIYRVFVQGHTFEEVHERNQKLNYSELQDKSFKIEFSTYRSTRPLSSQLQEIEKLEYMNLSGPIRMKDPEMRLVFVESYTEDTKELEYVWFTKLVSLSDRSSVDTYSLKKRRHVGTTSFDAELALVTSNIAQIQKGFMVYDPFSGTGSFPLAAAHYGAHVFASDIDIRPLRNYAANFEQYQTTERFLDAFEMDFTHNAFHHRVKFDAIICDPPYGVRERIVVCGAAKPERFVGKENVVVDNELSHLRRDYIATKKPYELSMMINDLFSFAADRLNEGRRLAFWLPLEESEVTKTKIPLHREFQFKGVCVQKFYKWERWLLTYERRRYGDVGPECPMELDDNFRAKYLARLEKD